MRPLHGNIIVEKVEKENKTAGGIILMKVEEDLIRRGKVVAIGECDVNGKPLQEIIPVGSTAVFSKYASPLDIDYMGVKALLINIKDVLAVE